MGYDIDYLYIGPMIVLSPLELIEEIDVPACMNEECRAFRKKTAAVFCPNCGVRVTHYSYDATKMATFHDFIEDEDMDNSKFDDALHSLEYEAHILLPYARGTEGICQFSGDIGEDSVFFDDIDTKTQIHTFKNHLKDALAALTEYGFDYTIKYGVKVY